MYGSLRARLTVRCLKSGAQTDNSKQELDVSLSEHQAVTAAFIQNALYLKVKSSYEKSNVLLKYLSE